MSFAQEQKAWEDGRLAGLKYALLLIQNTEMKSGFARLIRDMRTDVALAVIKQQKYFDETYGDDE